MSMPASEMAPTSAARRCRSTSRRLEKEERGLWGVKGRKGEREGKEGGREGGGRCCEGMLRVCVRRGCYNNIKRGIIKVNVSECICPIE